MLQRAARIGPQTLSTAEAMLLAKKHPDEAQRSILGLLKLGREYGPELLEHACAQAQSLSHVRYRTILGLLRMGATPIPAAHVAQSAVGQHVHVRGASYFDQGAASCTV